MFLPSVLGGSPLFRTVRRRGNISTFPPMISAAGLLYEGMIRDIMAGAQSRALSPKP